MTLGAIFPGCDEAVTSQPPIAATCIVPTDNLSCFLMQLKSELVYWKHSHYINLLKATRIGCLLRMVFVQHLLKVNEACTGYLYSKWPRKPRSRIHTAYSGASQAIHNNQGAMEAPSARRMTSQATQGSFRGLAGHTRQVRGLASHAQLSKGQADPTRHSKGPRRPFTAQ